MNYLTDLTPHCFYIEHNILTLNILFPTLPSIHVLNFESVGFSDLTKPTGKLFSIW